MKNSEPFLQPHSLLDETADHTPRRCAPLPARQEEEEKSVVDRNLFSPVSESEEEEAAAAAVLIEAEKQPENPGEFVASTLNIQYKGYCFFLFFFFSKKLEKWYAKCVQIWDKFLVGWLVFVACQPLLVIWYQILFICISMN